MKMSRPILILAILVVAAALYLFWRDHSEPETEHVAIRRPVAPASVQSNAQGTEAENHSARATGRSQPVCLSNLATSAAPSSTASHA